MQCPTCGAEVPADARFCPRCGEPLEAKRPSAEQHPLPFSPWGPPPMAQPAGAGAVAAPQPVVGPPLTRRQIGIAIGSILLAFLVIVFVFGRGLWPGSSPSTTPATTGGQAPVIGPMGALYDVGETAWGVAFTQSLAELDHRTPTRGQFFTVGVVVGNKSDGAIQLSTQTQSLVDADTGHAYTPVASAWGTPEELNAGQYAPTYALSPEEAVAGLLIFDVPATLRTPRLLVRDLAASGTAFTAAIDLTHEVESTLPPPALDLRSLLPGIFSRQFPDAVHPAAGNTLALRVQ